jgi:hypothetical protein
VSGQQKESVGDGVDETICGFDAAAFPGDVKPDIVEVSRSLWS